MVRHDIYLWTFGEYAELQSVGDIFYSRASLRPWLIEESPDRLPESHDEWMQWLSDHSQRRLSHRPREEDTVLLRRQLFSWLARYERWVSKEVGETYRDESVSSWRQSILPGRDLSDLWTFAASATITP